MFATMQTTQHYECDSDLHYLISRLEHDSVLAIEWFECNYMKLNQDKCHLLTKCTNQNLQIHEP